jgi:hypothetical protein
MAPDSSASGPGDAATPYGDSGVQLVSLFNGTTLDGWYYMDQGSTWSVVNAPFTVQAPK